MLMPKDTKNKLTMSYYNVGALAKDIGLTRLNVLPIGKDDVGDIQKWLDKINRVIPVKFVKVKSLDKADMVITLLNIPHWDDQLGGIAD